MRKITCNIWLGVFALLLLACIVLTVITLLPSGIGGFSVKQPLTVSVSQKDATGEVYLGQIRGVLFNENEKDLKLEALYVEVENAGVRERVVIDGVTVHAHRTYDVLYEWETRTPHTAVNSVIAVVDGEEIRISNLAPALIDSDTLVCLLGVLVFGLLGTFFVKQRYYIYQEDKMKKEKN